MDINDDYGRSVGTINGGEGGRVKDVPSNPTTTHNIAFPEVGPGTSPRGFVDARDVVLVDSSTPRTAKDP